MHMRDDVITSTLCLSVWTYFNIVFIQKTFTFFMTELPFLVQPRTRDPTRLSASLPGSRAGNEQQEAVLTSRLDDLALQLVYSDNRLSHVETRMLNASLSTCRKSNSDLYQVSLITTSIMDMLTGYFVERDG